MTETSREMTGVSSADLERYFDRYGWSADQLDDITFRTGFRGRNSTFTALVRLTEHWVVFTINPFMRPPPAGWGAASLTALAAANHQINLAKFGIDQEDDCFLTVELPTESFRYQHFTEAMTALTHVADAFVLSLLQARALDRAGAC